jgi:hypothetical protein
VWRKPSAVNYSFYRSRNEYISTRIWLGVARNLLIIVKYIHPHIYTSSIIINTNLCNHILLFCLPNFD